MSPELSVLLKTLENVARNIEEVKLYRWKTGTKNFQVWNKMRLATTTMMAAQALLDIADVSMEEIKKSSDEE